VFPHGRAYSQSKLQAHFSKVLLHNPWYDNSVPSLLYEKEGKVLGFIGVVARPMLVGAKVVRVAASNHFMVDPCARCGMAGVELLSNLFAGAQDLTIAEAGDDSRRLWEALGGRTSFGRSLFWTRILRIGAYTLHRFSRENSPLAWIGRPISGVIDNIAARVGHGPLRQLPQVPEKELSEKDLLTCLSQYPSSASLRPIYDDHSLRWLLTVLDQKKMIGGLRKVAVHDNRQMIGWYVYYLSPGAVSTVLQIQAVPDRFDQVFRHLCYHAWRQGSIALTGRLEPRFTKELSRNHCFLHWRSWMLVHSRNPAMLSAFESGNAVFTALEGEWWISIEGEQPDDPARQRAATSSERK
jgi:hypothetical protein